MEEAEVSKDSQHASMEFRPDPIKLASSIVHIFTPHL